MRRALLLAGAALAVVLAVCLLRAIPAAGPAPPSEPPLALSLDPAALAERLAGGLRIPTISHGRDSGVARDDAAFLALHRYLEDRYPRVHAALRRETVAGLSLLYTWPGSDPSLDPLLLMGHLDVVPVEAGTESEWEEPPFAGRVRDGFVWGRGAIDNKSAVFGILEAAEALLGQGFAPRRSVHFAFGHDEELGGLEGATAVVALLRSRGERLAMVVDEGGGLVSGLVPGVEAPVAAVGVAEKGYVSVELSVDAEGGHSSTPPAQSAIGILAAAVARLEARQMPGDLDGPMRQMLERVAPHMRLPFRLLFRNLWLFEWPASRFLLAMPRTAPALRTTTAPTIFEAGVKDNVLPSHARAVVNFRIHPRDSVEAVLEHVRRSVADPRVSVRTLPNGKAREPSSISPTDSPGFAVLERTIRQIRPDAVVSPMLILGGTDSRYTRELASDVYGFQPIHLEAQDLRRIHGTNERISVENLVRAARFYAQLLWNASRT
jgi:carboxypeptidase PM20D1